MKSSYNRLLWIVAPLLMLALLIWPAVGMWTTRGITGVYRVVYSLGVIGWAGIVARLIVAQGRQGELASWLAQTRNLRSNRLIIGLAIAVLWLAVRVILRLGIAASSDIPLILIIGVGLAAITGTVWLISLGAAPPENQPAPLTLGGGDGLTGLKMALAASAVAFIVGYLLIALLRIGYPFELEWMEGGSYLKLVRVTEGLPLYTAPSMDYVPYIYMPLYYYLSGLVALFTGPGFLAMRLVSFVASIGCMVLIFAFIKRETGSSFHGLLGVGLFNATFAEGGAWLDIGRVDALATFFVVAVIFMLRGKRDWPHLLLTSVLITLAFLTKQTMLLAILPLLATILISDWRYGLILAIAAGALVVSSAVALNVTSGGWFNYYVFGLPARHEVITAVLYWFWINDMWLPLAVLLVLAFSLTPHLPAMSMRAWRRWLEWLHQPDLFYLAMLAGVIGTAWAGKLASGGVNNVLIPAHAGLAIAVGVALDRVLRRKASEGNLQHAVPAVLVSVAALIQFATLLYNPAAYIPTAEDVAAGNHIVETIRAMDGDVLIVRDSYLGQMAGKPVHDIVSIPDLIGVYGGDISPEGLAIMEDLKQSIREQRYAAIIIETVDAPFGLPDSELLPVIQANYQKGPALIANPDVFWTRAGARVRPDQLYLRLADR